MSSPLPNRRVTFVIPREDKSLSDFHAHWSGPHAAIARDLPGLVWYVQNHFLRTLVRGSGRWDSAHGLAEIGFADPAGVLEAIQNWSRRDELWADEARFISDRVVNAAMADPDAPAPALRRMIAVLERPLEQSDIEETLQKLRLHLPAHAMRTANHGLSPSPLLTDGLIFVELPAQDHSCLDPAGPILSILSDLPAQIFLARAEAKYLPLDQIA